MLGTGLDFQNWSLSKELEANNGAIFFMDPSKSVTDAGKVLIAQLTVSTGIVSATSAMGPTRSKWKVWQPALRRMFMLVDEARNHRAHNDKLPRARGQWGLGLGGKKHPDQAERYAAGRYWPYITHVRMCSLRRL